jgi:transcription elongation factor GreA
MSKYTYLTQDGYDKLKADLEAMKTVGRQAVAKAIAEARDKGDLSENAEYSAAKDEQGLLEARINELEMVVISARILDDTQVDTSKVVIFTSVRLLHKKMNKEVVYKLVSETESNLKEGKISVTSPIGNGLLGKIVGDIAVVVTPNGNIEFEILEIFLA